MVDFFIRRPVFATVCALLIILPAQSASRRYPFLCIPISLRRKSPSRSNYVGANAQVVESAVTIPLEQQINGVEGMHYITSTSSNDGTSNINVVFDRLRPEYRRCRRAESRGYGAGPSAAGNQEHRHHHHKGESEFRLCRRILFAR